ncbi:MAG TPA: hypothetical protein VG713_12235 [Pirellulales bacterium]|nr:hypothetical protein [Pirellulales bacterium]
MAKKKKKSDKPTSSADEAEVVESMRKIAEGDVPPLTPEEAAAAAKAEREYIETLAPRHDSIATPVYKPPK